MVENHSLREIKASTINTLKSAGIENFMLESKEILKSLLNVSDNDLLLENENARVNLTDKTLEKLHEMLEKRKNGYPLQYLLGEWDFYGLKFFVGEGVLIPRPETELLVELAISHVKANYSNGKVNIADLFSGSGCVGVALTKHLSTINPIEIQMSDINSQAIEPLEINCKSVEISENAFAYLKKNIMLHEVGQGVQPILGSVLDLDILDKFDDESLDVILANPPYISPDEKHLLQRELDFEPDTALFAQDKGYYFYEQTIPLWKKKLKNGGLMAFEVGLGQFKKVCETMQRNELVPQIKSDDSGIERVIYTIKTNVR